VESRLFLAAKISHKPCIAFLNRPNWWTHSSSLRIWRHRNSLLFHRPNHVLGLGVLLLVTFNSVFVRDARPPLRSHSCWWRCPRAMGSSPGLKEFAGRRIVQRHQQSRLTRPCPSCSPWSRILVACLSDGRRRSATQWRQARGICAIGSGDVRSLLWVVPISDRLAANFTYANNN